LQKDSILNDKQRMRLQAAKLIPMIFVEQGAQSEERSEKAPAMNS
jgi:hypothetical protein